MGGHRGVLYPGPRQIRHRDLVIVASAGMLSGDHLAKFRNSITFIYQAGANGMG